MLEKGLAGPLNLLVKFSTLQEYGVDKPFFLENDNVDSSQRNVVFLVRGEKAKTVLRVAGMYDLRDRGTVWCVILAPAVRCLIIHTSSILKFNVRFNSVQIKSNAFGGKVRSNMSSPSSGYLGVPSSRTNCLKKLECLVRRA